MVERGRKNRVCAQDALKVLGSPPRQPCTPSTPFTSNPNQFLPNLQKLGREGGQPLKPRSPLCSERPIWPDCLGLRHKQCSESQFGITPKMRLEDVLFPCANPQAEWLCCVFGQVHCDGHSALLEAVWLPGALGPWALQGYCSKDMLTLCRGLFTLQPMKNAGSPLFPFCVPPLRWPLSHGH